MSSFPDRSASDAQGCRSNHREGLCHLIPRRGQSNIDDLCLAAGRDTAQPDENNPCGQAPAPESRSDVSRMAPSRFARPESTAQFRNIPDGRSGTAVPQWADRPIISQELHGGTSTGYTTSARNGWAAKASAARTASRVGRGCAFSRSSTVPPAASFSKNGLDRDPGSEDGRLTHHHRGGRCPTMRRAAAGGVGRTELSG